MRRGSVAVSAVVAGLLLAPPLVAQEVEAPPELVEIRFVGNQVFPDDSLAAAIVNRETRCTTIFFTILPFCPLGFDFAFDRHLLQRQELRRDAVRLELYHWLRGYRESQVDTALTRLEGEDAVRLTFRIQEGRPTLIDTIVFVGDALPSRRIIRGIPVARGDPLSRVALDRASDTIASRLRNSGYPRAEVFLNLFIPAGSYESEVEFDVFTGPKARFGEIDVRWTGDDPALDRRSVLRFLPFRTGDTYSRAQVLDAQRSLFGVELIQSASIVRDTLAESPDSLVPLIVTIREGDVHRVGAGGAWSTSECLSAESRWTSRNFLGSARRLTVRGRLSNVFAGGLGGSACPQAGEDEFAELNWLLSAELLQPWLFSSRNSLSASVFAERASLPDVFIRQAVGANLAVTRNLGEGLQTTLSYRPELSSLEAAEIFFCTSFLVCSPSDVDVLSGANWLAPIGVSASLDRTDNLLSPADGFSLLADYEHAGDLTGSDYAYDRLIGEASWYESFARRTVVALRVRGGWIWNATFRGGGLEQDVEVVHPQKRFFAGGSSSVRGFAENRLGPRVLTTDVSNLLDFRGLDTGSPSRTCLPEEIVDRSCDPAGLDDALFFPRPTGGTRLLEINSEYRFAVGPQFQGVVFTDAGQVWREGESIDLSDLEITPGVGVRYFSPIGPVRVDIGYRFRGGEALEVVTSQIRPFGSRTGDRPRDRICIDAPSGFPFEGEDTCGSADDRSFPIEFVRRDDLALLRESALFGEDGSFFRNLQLHFSIGQAF